MVCQSRAGGRLNARTVTLPIDSQAGAHPRSLNESKDKESRFDNVLCRYRVDNICISQAATM